MDSTEKEAFSLQKRTVPNGLFQASTTVWLMPSSFWDDFERCFIFIDVSGQLPSHIFKGQEAQEKNMSLVSVRKYQITLSNIPE
jgi:hypothetical protein